MYCSYTYKLFLEFTDESDSIFGSPIPVNYISFVTNRKIALNYFDSDLKHLSFESLGKLLKKLKEQSKKLLLQTIMEFLQVF
jgi:hypothetical protein